MTIVMAVMLALFVVAYFEEETSLSDADFAAARAIGAKDSAAINDDSAMYNPDLFEGDIANDGLNAHNIRSFIDGVDSSGSGGGVLRNALRETRRLWPNGRVPYTLSFRFSPYSRWVIASAITEYNENTCIRFVPRNPKSDKDYVYFDKDLGCYSYLGRTGGRQMISLGERCDTKRIVIHEMMHAVGFHHEQSRADRDQYVKINLQNIWPNFRYAFDKYSLDTIDHLGTRYDYDSIMHYSRTAFSMNGLPTIEPLQKGVHIGLRRGLSKNDITKINKLYNCHATSSVSSTSSINTVPSHATTLDAKASTTAPTVTTESTTATTKKPWRVCEDKLPSCLALKKAGYCNAVAPTLFMLSHCPVTFELCEDDNAAPCFDEIPDCGTWAWLGACTNTHLKAYISSKCSASCGLC